MKQEIFDDCLNTWKSTTTHKSYWNDLAVKWGYGEHGGEKLRSEFKYHRKKLGIQKQAGTVIRDVKSNMPRVGIIDIETLPAVVFSFGLYDQNISIDQIIQDICMLGWAGKFLNDSTMESDILTPKEAAKRDSSRIAKSCWEFLSKCDVVIGHNIQNFDAKHINTAFLQYGLPPLKYIMVDTLLVARQNFKFTSNKLKFINEKLNIRNKIDTSGFDLWRRCSEGDAEALETMREYNEGDIYATENLFYKLRPYIRNFNVALYNEIEERICPVCGSHNLKHEGYYMTSAGKWESIRCMDCQCLSRAKTNMFSAEKKKTLLINS